jgi:tetratricopeptide (TPR) repeat protein
MVTEQLMKTYRILLGCKLSWLANGLSLSRQTISSFPRWRESMHELDSRRRGNDGYATHLLAALISLCIASFSFQAQAEPKGNSASSGASTRAASEYQITISKNSRVPVLDPDVQIGYEALQQFNVAKARQSYLAALQRDGSQRDALLGLLHASHAMGDDVMGDNVTALNALKRLRELFPRDAHALAAGFLMTGSGAAETESRFKSLIDSVENSAPLYYALGVLYADQGRLGEAHIALDQAVARANYQADYVFNLAVVVDRMGHSAKAAKLYVRALNLSSDHPAAFSRDVARSRAKVLVNLQGTNGLGND